MDPKDYPRRYIHIVGAFVTGGTLTRVGPTIQTHLQLPTVASTELPSVGGFSESAVKGLALKGKDSGVAGLTPDLMDRELVGIGYAHSRVQSDVYVEGGPAGSYTLTEARDIRADAGFLQIDALRLEMRCFHPPNQRQPQLTFLSNYITGLRIGGHELTVTLDLDPFNRYPTFEEFETAFKNDAGLRRELAPRFVIDPATGGLYRNSSGYVVGSLLKSVSGLPSNARLNGWTIEWEGFGRLVLGEVFMAPQLRRATLVRIVHSDGDAGSGCTGGSWYP